MPHTAPEFEFVSHIPGLAGVYSGIEGFRRFLEEFWDEFDDIRVEVGEAVAAGDQVLVPLTSRGRGKQSGVDVSWDLWHVWTVRDGKVVRGQGFTSRQDALEAVGVTE